MRYSGVVLHLAQSSLAAPFVFIASVALAANVSGKSPHNVQPFPDYSTRPLRVLECGFNMAWKVEYASETGTVVLTACGEIRNEDATEQATETIRLLKQNQAGLVLIDYSDALPEVSLPTLYGLPDHYSQAGAPWHARAAVVLPRTRYRIESYQFFELVCKNAGYDVKLFETRDAAEDWLAQTSPSRESEERLAHA